MIQRLALLACALPLVFLTGCGDKDKDPDPPAELVDLKPKIKIKEVWSTSLGGGTERLRLGLRPDFDGDRLYVADHDGDVLALRTNDGRQIWRAQTKLPLSGGPGFGAGRVVVGSAKGDVLAFNAADGKELWKVSVRGEVIASPALDDTTVVLRTVDGKLRALDATSGKELWVVEQQVPRLTVRGTASPVINGDLVICGFDNGKVVAVSLKEGDTVWETSVNAPHGRTELERLVDIDSQVRVEDKDVFVVGFQGRAAMLALESGQIWWARDASSDRGLVVNPDTVFVSTASGDVMALKRRDGTPLWEQNALHRRGLSGPAIVDNTIVVADFEGYVHWLDAATGDLLARESTDGARVTNAPVVDNGMVFVLTDSGRLAAFRRTDQPAAEKPAEPSG
jgi:outer membrane protein assembly factor BamB